MSLSATSNKSFLDAVPDIVKIYGVHVQRRDLMGYCFTHHIAVPPFHQKMKVGHGVYNLEPFMRELKLPTPVTLSSGGQTATNVDGFMGFHNIHADLIDKRTDAEIEETINSHFVTADMITSGIIDGDAFAMICSGNPGIGKTYNIEALLQNAADEGHIEYHAERGYSRPTGLFKLMYANRAKNQVLLIDDMDSIFEDVLGLNLLKAALDTKPRRELSWLSEKIMVMPDGEEVPKSFVYEGRIIFITNVDFELQVQRRSKISEHLKALMSRCDYVDLNLNTTRELMIRIKSVIKHSDILKGSGLTKASQAAILNFLETHKEEVRELSLRTVVRLRKTMVAAHEDVAKFEQMARATSLKQNRGMRF